MLESVKTEREKGEREKVRKGEDRGC